MSKTITAAGGVVWQMRDGAPDVLLVHRPRYNDWSLPKGKPIGDEAELLTAVREVDEETGAQVAVQQRIGIAKYSIHDTRKRVSYWSMRYLRGDFAPNDEVDDIAWLRVGRAYRKLSYQPDRKILSDFADSPVVDSVVVLVRHAKAGKRSEWKDDDRLRPLDPAGRKQADELARQLATFAPTRIYSADRTRCEQTVTPLAEALDLRVRLEPAFSDEAHEADPAATLTALLALAKPGKVSVVCSQGDTIPAIVDQLGVRLRSSDTRKAAWWVLSVVDGEVIASDYYDPPC